MSTYKYAGTKKWTKDGSGFLGGLGPEQKECLERFLKEVPPAAKNSMKMGHETDESFGCRILRARRFDVPAAIAMVEKCAAWRESYGATKDLKKTFSEILGIPRDEFRYHVKAAYLDGHYDVYGRPLYFDRTGSADLEAALMLCDIDNIVRMRVVEAERNMRRLIAATKRKGEVVDSMTTVVDLKGLTIGMITANTTKKFLSTITDIDQNYYPETMGRTFFINTPKTFSIAWKLFKGLVDKRTREKIEILGKDYYKRLTEFIPETSIPEEYGGKLKIPGGLFSNERNETFTVKSGSVATRSVPVKAGETVRIKFFTRPGDLEFLVSFKGADGKEQVVEKKQRYKNSNKEQYSFTFEAKTDGEYIPTWDNSKGWRQRDVIWRWDPMGPDGQPIEKRPYGDYDPSKEAEELDSIKEGQFKGPSIAEAEPKKKKVVRKVIRRKKTGKSTTGGGGGGAEGESTEVTETGEEDDDDSPPLLDDSDDDDDDDDEDDEEKVDN